MFGIRAVVEGAVQYGRKALQFVQRRNLPVLQQLQGQAPEAQYKLSKELVRRIASPLWTEAKRRTTRRLVFGESVPLFGLVGVTLMSGSQQGLVTKEDELESICSNIRETIAYAGHLRDPDFCQFKDLGEEEDAGQWNGHIYSLADLKLGSIIDKGCNAAVYAAKWKTADQDESHSPPLKRQKSDSPASSEEEQGVTASRPQFDVNITEEQMPHTIVESLTEVPLEIAIPSESTQEKIGARGSNMQSKVEQLLERPKRVQFKEDEDRGNSRMKRPLEMLHDEIEDVDERDADDETDLPDKEKYPLAVKMLFNYEAESNAPAILRAMYKELLPAQSLQLEEEQLLLREMFCSNLTRLPSHPNIVEMPCVFVDRIPLLEDSMKMYPDALPSRLNPSGYGRNMSLFCVMKRYDTSLKDYVKKHKPPAHTSLLILTQLLEAILHINSNNVVHRDLKADNILLDLDEGSQYPSLVLTDFGCCLAAEDSSMSAYFPTRESDPRQGNSALMAPEVKLAKPGLLQYVNYSQSDLWTVGAIAYEIYGQENPFFPINSAKGGIKKGLESGSYKESQLPRLPKEVPAPIKHLIEDLLHRNPRKRPSPSVAATLCQLVLWAPKHWLCKHALTLPSESEIMQWLLCHTTRVLCEARLSQLARTGRKASKGLAQLESKLLFTFLSRVHYRDIMEAIKWNRTF